MNTHGIVVSNKRIFFVFSVLLFFTFSGCVSSTKYRALESNYEDLELEMAAVKKKNKKLTKEKRRLEEVKNQMIENLKKEIEEKTVRIEMLEQKLKVTAIEKLFFNSGSAVVKRKGQDVIAKIANTLNNASEMEIHIIGHADTRPPGKKISDKYPSNWELSTTRATSIVRVLQWGHGIDPKRMVASGVGHYRPSVAETKDNRAMNRFVEITLAPMAPGN